MKQVFVETNFLIELLRPFPGHDATRLFARRTTDVRLHLPWVSVVEAKRTLDRIIKEDLGFAGAMQKFGVRELRDGGITAGDKQFLDGFAARAAVARARALTDISASVDAAIADMSVIEPSRDVVQKTLTIYPVKSLKPFDEMVLGAVLTKAAELHGAGVPDLFFCDLNKSDFDPANKPTLQAEYASCGLTYLASFHVPA